MSAGDNSQDGEILFEFIAMGRQMRVAAIHAPTGIEIVVALPLTATRSQMQALATAKLRRRLANLKGREGT